MEVFSSTGMDGPLKNLKSTHSDGTGPLGRLEDRKLHRSNGYKVDPFLPVMPFMDLTPIKPKRVVMINC